MVPAMIELGRSRDCLFCQVTSTPSPDLRWHDRPLARVPAVGAVVAGLGAFVPGYVLVFPEQHVESTVRIHPDTGAAFDDLLHRTVETVTAVFGPATVFEHGSCSSRESRRSACIDHAHTHIIPGVYGLSRAIADRCDHTRGQLELYDSADLGYLMLQEPESNPLYTADLGVSQFFRRCIAARLGISDEWDYLLYPRFPNVRETIARFAAEPAEINYSISEGLHRARA